MLNTASVHPLHTSPAEPGIHPTAAKIRDIILTKAADGEPAMEEDFADFTLAEFKTHFPAGRAAAHKQIVRQVDDDPGFETRAQLLVRATRLLLGKLPDVLDIHNTLRTHGITNAEIADLWPELIESAGNAFKLSRVTPLHEAH